MSKENKKTAWNPADEEMMETVNEKTLMDQLDTMKTSLRGYDKEATCELLQKVIRTMEAEKKEENGVLLRKNQRLQSEKDALTKQMAELQAKVDSLESERQRMAEQQGAMQTRYEELAEKLGRISENAIDRDAELSGYHLRDQQMKDREAAIQNMEHKKAEELEQIKKEFTKKMNAEREAALAKAQQEARDMDKRTQQLRSQLQDFKKIINSILDFPPEAPKQVARPGMAGEHHDRAGI